MQSFIAKHSEYEEQVIANDNFLIIIRKLPYPGKVNIEYKLAKGEAKNEGAKIQHIAEKETIIEKIIHKPLQRILRKGRIMKLPVRWDEERD